MQTLKFPFIFGSSSSARLKLLQQININPDNIVKHDVDEISLKNELPRIFAERMAQEKMQSICKNVDLTQNLILTVDTIAACGRRILQKPSDDNQARDFLTLLSGRRHKVYTAMCFSAPDREKIIFKTSTTILKFKRLNKSEIDHYIENREWQGKAGGYGVQGLAASFIEWINGSADAVAGLPLCIIYKLFLPYIKYK